MEYKRMSFHLTNTIEISFLFFRNQSMFYDVVCFFYSEELLSIFNENFSMFTRYLFRRYRNYIVFFSNRKTFSKKKLY